MRTTKAKKTNPLGAGTKGAKTGPREVHIADRALPPDPAHTKRLLARRLRDTDPEPFISTLKTSEPLAEHLGESFIEAATMGEAVEEDVVNEEVPEELGGPFVVSPAREEFAPGTDASNPKGAEREPFPKT
jgi:hypothetical protein